MSESPKSKKPGRARELSTEIRLLIAFVLTGIVLFLTPYFYKPPAPPPAANKKAPAAVQQVQQAKQAPLEEKKTKPARAPRRAARVPAVVMVSGAKEEEFEVNTQLYRIRFTNRGAVVRSWVLKKYLDSTGKPLELVNAKAAGKTGHPFSLVFSGQKPETDLSQALFLARQTADPPAIEFEYSDGKVQCRKSFRFHASRYRSELSTEVVGAASRLPHLVAWRGGFGDLSIYNPASTQHSMHFNVTDGKLVQKAASDAEDGPAIDRGNFSFAGLEDTYFAAVALPVSGTTLEVRTYADLVPTTAGDKEETYLGAAVGGEGENRLTLFVGPKNMDVLRRVDPKLESMVDFGWFAFLAKPLFLILNWLTDRWIHNYGWSIVLVTIAINLLLMPLKITNLKSMKQMQMLQPKIAAINERFKGIGLRDPRKQQQNQEVMDLYKKHGVNPMGGCMPLVLQMPFFIAFWKVLTVAIEMRGAGWLWVRDLSQPEHIPIRLLPVAMIATQFVLQKMTPTTTVDPMQQKMMLLMPLMFGFMFYSASSGLVLYWLTGNLVGIAQQVLFNRLVPSTPPIAKPAATPKGSRK